MDIAQTSWRFADTFDACRRSRAERYDTFEKVISYLRQNASVTGACICEATQLGVKCSRPVVQLFVGEEGYDAFFNSPGGYRAQYLQSAARGLAANAALLDAFEPVLTAAVVADAGKDRLTLEDIRNSFFAASAKFWIDEAEEGFNVLDQSNDIDIAPWITGCEYVHAPIGIGAWAPRGEHLMAVGAFIDAFGNEVVAKRKIKRRFDIHHCGYS